MSSGEGPAGEVRMRVVGRRRGRADTGASAVEFAIVVPILLLLIIGMLEFAFVMRDYLSVSSATRTGARIAATGASLGPGDCPGGAIVCDPEAVPVPKLAQRAVDAIQMSGMGMPEGYVDYVLVYKSNDKGFPGSAGNETMPDMNQCTAMANCIAFRWHKTAKRYIYVGGAWNSSLIDACPPASGHPQGPDSVGVYMKATHPYLSRLFGATMTITNRSVMQFEPLPVNQCGPGQHL